MKTVDQFDYPTAAATSFKAYQQQPQPQPKQHEMHYQKVNRLESEHQRNRVQAKEHQKKKVQTTEQLSRIREDLEKKRREVKELEVKMQQAVESERQAAQMAKLKEQKDRIRKYEEEQKAQENQENAQFRFKDALRRLQNQRQENAIQERQAQNRRKVNQEADKVERSQAIRFKEWQRSKEQEEARMVKEEEDRQVNLMRVGVARTGFNRPGVDFSKTCQHNPHMVFKSFEGGPNAFERGQSQEKQRQEQQNIKKQRQEDHRQRSVERGETALQRIRREREYRVYERETQQQQIGYNLQRIEEGKKNQFVGVKPLTLGQLESNKKIRGEQQFEDMFLAPQVTTFQQPASKYLIIERQHPASEEEISRQFSSYDGYQQGLSRREAQQIEVENQEEVLEKPMMQTRAEGGRAREELYYSQSEEDSSYT